MNKRSLQLSGQQDMRSAICPGGRVYVSPVRWTDGQTETEMLLPSFRPMPDTRSSSSAGASAPAPGSWIPALYILHPSLTTIIFQDCRSLNGAIVCMYCCRNARVLPAILTTGYISLCVSVCVGFYLV